MATPTFFTSIKELIGNNVVNLNTDTMVIYLTNAAPNFTTHTVRADNVGLTNGVNGYNQTGTGPQPAMATSWVTDGATGFKLVNDADISWTATGGSIGPFTHVLMFDDTPTSPVDPLVLGWAVGGSTTITDGNIFTVDLNSTFDLFTLD